MNRIEREIMDQAVRRAKQALIKNRALNGGQVVLSGPHSARFTGSDHEGWKKPLTKRYVLKLVGG